MPQYSGIWTEQAVMQAVGAGNWPGNPGAPTIGTATAGDASASVTFTAPTDNGGSAITGYTVTSSPGGLTGTGASSPITVSGLTNGTAYTFTVTATNATGTGPASAASNSVTPEEPVYIEDVYSTYLYKGNASTQTITNGIDLAGKGGMVWTKSRTNANEALIYDTVRGVNNYIIPSSTQEAQTSSGTLTAFNSNGFTLGANDNSNDSTTENSVGWTFREQPKFFDVVTWTGDASGNRTLSHALTSTPACIIIKATNATDDWYVYHTSLGTNKWLYLNTTSAEQSGSIVTAVSSTTFTVSQSNGFNTSGRTYVAYLFAHNAGGFGLTGTDNVISCGSFTTDGSGAYSVTLGYEPQFVLMKRTDSTGDWLLMDNMRGMPVGGNDAILRPNTSGAETQTFDCANPSATGFYESTGSLGLNRTFIYIAIRRGPMKVPTSGTSVFTPTLTASASETVNNIGFTPDMQLIKQTGNAVGTNAVDRLRGVSTRYQYNDGKYLLTNSTAAEASNYSTQYWNNTGFSTPYDTSGISTIYWTFRRAPSFFDEVCYTGAGGQALTHNLGVTPQLIIVKARSYVYDWIVYSATTGTTNILFLNLSNAVTAYTGFTSVTSNTFSPAGVADQSGQNFVAYLFATCPGVSKVGSYTGTGALQTINCGFSGGARFVMIKRTNTSGSWFVWDTARGMVSGTDPSLTLNTANAEYNANSIYTATGGFQILASPAEAINNNGDTYIFLAIA